MKEQSLSGVDWVDEFCADTATGTGCFWDGNAVILDAQLVAIWNLIREQFEMPAARIIAIAGPISFH